MKLYELFEAVDFEDDDALRVKTTATLAGIKSDIEDGGFNGEFTVKALLKKLHNNGINISREQLIELVGEEPWVNFISNIQDDLVIFKSEDDVVVGPDDEMDSEMTLDQMSKRASKKKPEL